VEEDFFRTSFRRTGCLHDRFTDWTRRANERRLRVGTNVITRRPDPLKLRNGGTQCELELSTAGLILGARVEKNR